MEASIEHGPGPDGPDDQYCHDELRKSLEALTDGIQVLGGKPTASIAIAAEVRHRIERIED
jgi:hypothetical protein